jgi:osmoprotectant transport system ATP-binding protein
VTYQAGGRPVLADFNLAIEPGETIVLLGRSGSGKTTALRLVNGLIFPASGQVLVEGKPTTEWNPVDLKRRIGYVIQEAGLFPHFTVAANVGIVPRLAGWPPEKIAARVTEMLANVGLPEYAERFPKSLSGGQRQRVGVARALAGNPSLLLLDEPFGALDPVTRLELQRQFLRLRETALFVTHDVREALLLASRVALLHEGHLEVLATPADFVHSENAEARAFLEVLENVV